MTPEIDRARLLGDLEQLRAIGRRGQGVERPAFSAADREARDWLAQRMAAAGLDAHIDGIGNVHGRCAAPRAVLAGSHSDTVPGGGWLDGALGVIGALEAARVVNETASEAGVGVDVVSFADEEGTFRGTLGSRAFCGELADDELAQAVNRDGTRLADALADSGWAGRPIERLDPRRHVAFMELHIEQGPVLEAAGDEVGVVTGIVGLRRIALTFHGRADHAGTTPMALREDAGAAAVDFASSFAAEMARVAGPDTVWNVGALQLRPGFGNVVPERADVIIEYRDLVEELLAQVDDTVAELAATAAARHRATHAIDVVARTPPLATDPALVDALTRAAEHHRARHRRMPSGAGHDALVIGAHVPAGMLFAPSIGGRSHHASEDTTPDDLARAAQVMTTAIAGVAASAARR